MTQTAKTLAPDIEITIQPDTFEGKESARLPVIPSHAEM